MLCLLVERAGKLVTTHELFDAVWPDTAVTPQSLTNVIVELRKALGDTPAAPRFIETVPKRGFRFVAPVTTGAVPALSPSARVDSPSPTPRATTDAIFVGRESESAALARAWRQALAGGSRVVFVTGEAGIGKTTLLRSFLDQVQGGDRAGALVAVAGCVEQSAEREPYLPVLEALEQLTARDEHGVVGELLARYAPTWLAQLPWLLPMSDMFVLQQNLMGIGPGRMLLEVVAFLEAVSERIPVVLVIDDLHWADGPTLDVIAKIAQRTSPARMMVLGSYRPADAIARAHPVVALADRLCANRTATSIDVGPFDAGAVATYLARRFDGDEVVARLSQILSFGSGGNPLFLQAIVDDLLERDWIVRDGGRWRLADGFEPASVAIPDDLRRMIERQLATLDRETIGLLEAASVAGIEFAVDAVAEAAARPSDEVALVCRGLVGRGHFLRAAPGAEWPDGGGRERYAFTHALYQAVLYDRLPAGRRTSLHLAVGERIERAFAAAPLDAAAELARHFERGGDAARAVIYLRFAFFNALRRVAFNEVRNCISAAIGLLDQVPPYQRMPELEADLYSDLGDILTATDGGGSEVAADAYRHAETAYQGVGSARGLFRAHMGLCNSACTRADYAAASAHVEQLLALSRSDLPTLSSQAHCYAGVVALFTGRIVDGREHLERCLAETPEAGLPPSFDVHRYARGLVSIALAQLGHLTASREAAIGAEPTGRTVGDVFAGIGGAFGWLMIRDRERLERSADQIIDIAHENAFPVFVPLARLCRLALTRGPAATVAAAEMRDAFAEFRESRVEEMKGLLLGMLAEVHVAAGELDHAERFLDEGFRHSIDTGEHLFMAELHRIRGVLALAERPRATELAERELRTAMRLAREQQARLIELRAAVALAEMLPKKAARDLLRPLHAWFVDAGEVGQDVVAAAELLATLG